MKKLIYLSLALAFISCTTQSVKKSVHQEAKSEKASPSIAHTMRHNQETIQNSKALTDEQKTELLNLQRETYGKVHKHIADMTKLKKVLFNSFSKGKYSEQKVNYIAKEINKINKKKMDLMFASLKKAKKILNGVEDDEINQAVFMLDRMELDN